MARIEILAPVGSEEMLRAAVFSGADAVYLGFSGFNARTGAGNFDADSLQEAVRFCHARGVAVHVALNTTVYGTELPALEQAIRAVAASGADAVICQDLAAATLIGKIAPQLPRHGSTQMSVHTLQGALELKELGFTRVVLARELSLPEVEHITKHCGIETECFVHGALCMCVSGQCYMSAFLGGRSGNRGSCAGPCRLPFEANPLPEGKPGRLHHLSLKDNSVIDKLDNHKVNTRYIQKVPDGMGTWLAIFDNDGDVHAAISKRPDTTPLTTLLEEKGDEIFKDCDSIALELDLEKETVKQTLKYAKKYGKKVYAAVSNMSIAMERRDFLQQVDCFVCNQQEAGLLFSDDYDHLSPAAMREVLAANVHSANIPCMVVTMGGQGAVYARANGESGVVPAKKVDVIDTTGAGDAFFAGTVIGLTYGKNLPASCEIGSRLAASVISITENVCPRFRPLEFGLDIPVLD